MIASPMAASRVYGQSPADRAAWSRVALWRGVAGGVGGALMPVLIALALLLGGVTAVTAQTPVEAAPLLVVRGGEHDGFTRLTLQADGPLDWSLGGLDGDTAVIVNGVSQADLSRAFARISRARVADIRAEAVAPGPALALRLALTGEFSVTAFEDRAGLLVLDIRDRTPPPRVPDATTTPPDAVPGPDRPPARPEDDPPPASATSTAAPDPSAGAAAAWLRAHTDPPSAASDQLSQPDTRPPDGAMPGAQAHFDPMLQDARSQLATQLSRAASQSALQLGPVGASSAPLASEAAPDMPHEPVMAPVPAPEALAGLSVTTVVDREAGRGGPVHLVTALNCTEAPALDPVNWGNPSADWSDIVAARARLLGDFDRPLPGAVADLVHAYLLAGLGLEASAVLAAFPDEVAAAQTLIAASVVLEGDTIPDSPVARMQGCPGPAAVWAVLAAGEAPPRDALDRPALVMAFASMPRSLRRNLGPRLAGLFLAAGEPALAGTLQDIAFRGVDRPDPPGILFEATLALDGDNPAQAIALLRPLAGSVLPEGPEAAVLLVDAHLAAGHPVPTGLRELLGVLEVELRDSDQAPRLRSARVLAKASAGDFDAAFAQRDRLEVALPDPALRRVDHQLLGFLAADGSDAAVLRHAPGAAGWRGGTAPPELRQALAARFLALGVPDLALAALTDEPRVPQAERMLRAQALLATGRPAAALAELGGLDDPDADTLRGEALVALGDVAAAVAARVQGGDAEGAAALAWRSGDGDLIAVYGTPAQRAALAAAGRAHETARGGPQAEATDDPIPGRPDLAAGPPRLDAPVTATPVALADDSALAEGAAPAPGPLTAARDLLADGATLRADLATLLEAYPAP